MANQPLNTAPTEADLAKRDAYYRALSQPVELKAARAAVKHNDRKAFRQIHSDLRTAAVMQVRSEARDMRAQAAHIVEIAKQFEQAADRMAEHLPN